MEAAQCGRFWVGFAALLAGMFAYCVSLCQYTVSLFFTCKVCLVAACTIQKAQSVALSLRG